MAPRFLPSPLHPIATTSPQTPLLCELLSVSFMCCALAQLWNLHCRFAPLTHAYPSVLSLNYFFLPYIIPLE